jgi:hypothetical protein
MGVNQGPVLLGTHGGVDGLKDGPTTTNDRARRVVSVISELLEEEELED